MNRTPISSDKPSNVLGAIKSPMIFNAFSILVMGFLVWRTADLQPTPLIVWIGVGFILSVTVWLNIFAAVNPRFLAYGPREYLRQSEMSHEMEMEKLRKP